MLASVEIETRYLYNEIAAPAKQIPSHRWKFSKVHTDSRFACGLPTSAYILLYN
jgi:hypothetical protein